MKLFRVYLVAILGMFTVAAEGQCLLHDNLDTGTCCASVNVVLPSNFPNIGTQAKGICWNSCAVSAQTCNFVSVTPPTPTPICSVYKAQIDVSDCAGQSLMTGALVLDYTRTWEESVVAGQADYQVWRFVAKVEMSKANTLPASCPTPACLDSVSDCFFYGYVDYARHCQTLAWESSLVLFHGCDDFQHKPVFSSTPGVFHPGESYAIVAPDTVANPFVPALAPPIGGGLVAEAMRSLSNFPGTPCFTEDFLVSGQFTPDQTGCVCPLGNTPFQYTTAVMDGVGFCGNAFGDLNLWPTFPWYDVVTASIGTWTTPASYPGPERVWAAEGLFRYGDVCNATGVIEKSFDIFYGAITEQGYQVLPTPIHLLTQNFVDLASNYTAPTSGPYPFPIYGFTIPTEHLIYVNY